jgi:hypothetical protein
MLIIDQFQGGDALAAKDKRKQNYFDNNLIPTKARSHELLQ